MDRQVRVVPEEESVGPKAGRGSSAGQARAPTVFSRTQWSGRKEAGWPLFWISAEDKMLLKDSKQVSTTIKLTF